MKFSVLTILLLFILSAAAAQDSTAIQYGQLKTFLSQSKKDSFQIVPENWQANYQKQYSQLLAINKKKEFYPELIYDSRFVSHALPARLSNQAYIWVDQSPKYKNFKEVLMGEASNAVIQSIIGKPKKPMANGYYTPVGMKF